MDSRTIKIAYKKLKSSLFFDKTNLRLRDDIVAFECEQKDLEGSLDKLWSDFADVKRWKKLKQTLLDSIGIITYPKKINTDGVGSESEALITNVDTGSIRIKDHDCLQYFINMDVRAHILGVLWILCVGCDLDYSLYEHSYGNRIRKILKSEKTDEPTYSPYLFEPYFSQYSSWRDKGLTHAQEMLENNHDVSILTLDFARFYYSVDITKEAYNSILSGKLRRNVELNQTEDELLIERIHEFVHDVISKYSEVHKNLHSEGGESTPSNILLPIGFLPSNVLANWALSKFDKAVVDGWNPLYYGRYVDDIIIVEKLEKNSDIYKKAHDGSLSKQEALDFFLVQCSKWNGFNLSCESKESIGLFHKEGDTYSINPLYCVDDSSEKRISVQNEKMKVFYFSYHETDALIQCFKKEISRNVSEFRLFPDDEEAFVDNDYSEVYSLSNDETINKLRGVRNVELDRFALSKFLGKYLRISSLINDKIEYRFFSDIKKIFHPTAIVENSAMWEKVIEVLVAEEKLGAATSFINDIVSAMFCIEIACDSPVRIYSNLIETMFLHLHAAVSRSFSLLWGQEIKKCIEGLHEHICKTIREKGSFFSEDKKTWLCEHFSYASLLQFRKRYCMSRMHDKYVVPIVLDALIIENSLYFVDGAEEKRHVNLTKFSDMLHLLHELHETKQVGSLSYVYYPYMLNMSDFSMLSMINAMLDAGSPKSMEINKIPLDKIVKENLVAYVDQNYHVSIDPHSAAEVKVQAIGKASSEKNYAIKVSSKKKQKLKVAIANVELLNANFEKSLIGTPDRSYHRYHNLASIMNAALIGKADMLVMPECMVPFEWIPHLSRFSAKNNLAIITGVEHVRIGDAVFNLTAVLLPYVENNHPTALLSFHLKKHYAPHEEQLINGYGLTPIEGTHYELYCWNDCWFPVYCCYELASINDRSIFFSYLDMLLAVEWNKDTNYYSNIIDSLSRDLHCYCVQVNSSSYGDSRITVPDKTEKKDLIKVKGGKNSTILIDSIDIQKLRNFQRMGTTLQQEDKSFKITPPEFDRKIVELKIRGSLWEHLACIGNQNEQ